MESSDPAGVGLTHCAVDKVLLRLGGARVTTGRALQVGGILVLLLGVVLPYLALEHFDESFAVITETASLRGAGALTGLDATYLPSYNQEIRPDFNVAFNVLGIGPTLQIFGSLVAAVTCWACSTTRSTSSSGGRCTCPAIC